MSNAIAEYLARKDEQIDARVMSPMYDAWLLQEDIKARRKQLEADELRLAEMMKALTVTSDIAFNVTDTRIVRKFNEQWVKENMPELYDKLKKITPTARMKVFSSCFTNAEIDAYLAERKPEELQKQMHVTMTDFKNAVGEKKFESLSGQAYDVECVATDKSEIVLKQKPIMLDYGSMLESGNDE